MQPPLVPTPPATAVSSTTRLLQVENRPRTVKTRANGLQRADTQIHIQRSFLLHTTAAVRHVCISVA